MRGTTLPAVARSRFSFSADVWEYDGPAAWFFVSVPESDADAIEEIHGDRAGGFGSIRVEVTIGATTWRTSLFPDRKLETYVLPVKKEVRRAEGLDAGTTARVDLEILG